MLVLLSSVTADITVSLHDAILSVGHRSKGVFSSASQVQGGLWCDSL